MLKDYFLLAIKSLVNKKIRSWLTLLGIFIGVAAVVGLIGLGEGLRSAITSQFGISSTEVLTVQAGGISAAGPPGMGAVDPLTDDDAKAIARLSSVKRAVPRIMQNGKIQYNNMVSFGMVMSIPDGDNRKFTYDAVEIEAEFGRMLKDGDYNKIILGHNYYEDDNAFQKKIRVQNV